MQGKGLRKERMGVEGRKLAEMDGGTGCLEEGVEGQLLAPAYAVVIMKSRLTVWWWRA